MQRNRRKQSIIQTNMKNMKKKGFTGKISFPLIKVSRNNYLQLILILFLHPSHQLQSYHAIIVHRGKNFPTFNACLNRLCWAYNCNTGIIQTRGLQKNFLECVCHFLLYVLKYIHPVNIMHKLRVSNDVWQKIRSRWGRWRCSPTSLASLSPLFPFSFLSRSFLRCFNSFILLLF